MERTETPRENVAALEEDHLLNVFKVELTQYYAENDMGTPDFEAGSVTLGIARATVKAVVAGLNSLEF